MFLKFAIVHETTHVDLHKVFENHMYKKEKIMTLKKDNKGFTLMEMLIVVAIIAILIAIMIPVFNAQLEKSREAADAANIRAAYAQVMVEYLDDSKAHSESVSLQQATDDWGDATIKKNINDLFNITDDTNAKPIAGGTATISVDATGAVTLAYAAGA